MILAHVNWGCVNNFFCLIFDDSGDLGVRMTNPDSGNTGNEIQISISLVVIEILFVTMMNEKWFFIIVEIELWHIFHPIFENLLIRDSLIGGSLVVTGR